MRSVKDFKVRGKRVLVRGSFNVPFNEKGNIEDDFRIRENIPTIQYLCKQGARVILIGHVGRPTPIWEVSSSKFQVPQGQSLKPIAERLQELLRKNIRFIAEPIGEQVTNEIEAMELGEIVMVENLRFYKGEVENDKNFARFLARMGDLYVNDAFDVCHRANASVEAVTTFLPSAAGFLLEKEVNALKKIVEHPKKPMVVVVGGAKVETKGSFLDRISRTADAILLGNLISGDIKKSETKFRHKKKFVFSVDGVPNDETVLDIGPKTISLFVSYIRRAKTVFWAGPLGKIEEKKYQKGSLAIARAILKSRAFSVVGGGDLNSFLDARGLREEFGHASTGGGALLAFLAGEKLPGLEALDNQE